VATSSLLGFVVGKDTQEFINRSGRYAGDHKVLLDVGSLAHSHERRGNARSRSHKLDSPLPVGNQTGEGLTHKFRQGLSDPRLQD